MKVHIASQMVVILLSNTIWISFILLKIFKNSEMKSLIFG